MCCGDRTLRRPCTLVAVVVFVFYYTVSKAHLTVVVLVSDCTDSLPDAHHDLVRLLVLRRAGSPTPQLADFLFKVSKEI